MIVGAKLELDLRASALVLILLHGSSDYVKMELSKELVSSLCPAVVAVQRLSVLGHTQSEHQLGPN